MAFPSNSNTNINNELYANLVAAAQFAAYESSIARQIVSVFDMPANAGKVVQVPVWAAITAQNIADEAAATAKTTNTTSANITLTEHVVYHQVTDMLRDSAYNNVLTQLGDQSGRAIAEKMDAQVFANFGDFDEAAKSGTANLAITTDTIISAASQLRARKLTGPFVCVLHPAQAYNLKKQLTYVGSGYAPAATSAAESVFQTGYLGSIAGVQVYESGLIDVNGTSGDAVGAIFAQNAIGHSMRGAIRLETQRQAAYRATDLVLTAVAGAATLQTGFGLKITSDASFGAK